MQHVLCNVLSIPDNCSILRALNRIGIRCVLDFLFYCRDANCFDFEDDTGQPVPLRYKYRHLLQSFHAYYLARPQPFTMDSFFDMNATDFKQFCIANGLCYSVPASDLVAVPLTLEQQERLLKHVTCDLLELHGDRALEQSLLYSQTFVDALLSMSRDDLRALTYKDSEGHVTNVPPVVVQRICVLQQYSMYLTEIGNPITDWHDITVDDVHEFITGPHFDVYFVLPTATRSKSTSLNASSCKENIKSNQLADLATSPVIELDYFDAATIALDVDTASDSRSVKRADGESLGSSTTVQHDLHNSNHPVATPTSTARRVVVTPSPTTGEAKLDTASVLGREHCSPSDDPDPTAIDDPTPAVVGFVAPAITPLTTVLTKPVIASPAGSCATAFAHPCGIDSRVDESNNWSGIMSSLRKSLLRTLADDDPDSASCDTNKSSKWGDIKSSRHKSLLRTLADDDPESSSCNTGVPSSSTTAPACGESLLRSPMTTTKHDDSLEERSHEDPLRTLTFNVDSAPAVAGNAPGVISPASVGVDVSRSHATTLNAASVDDNEVEIVFEPAVCAPLFATGLGLESPISLLREQEVEIVFELGELPPLFPDHEMEVALKSGEPCQAPSTGKTSTAIQTSSTAAEPDVMVMPALARRDTLASASTTANLHEGKVEINFEPEPLAPLFASTAVEPLFNAGPHLDSLIPPVQDQEIEIVFEYGELPPLFSDQETGVDVESGEPSSKTLSPNDTATKIGMSSNTIAPAVAMMPTWLCTMINLTPGTAYTAGALHDAMELYLSTNTTMGKSYYCVLDLKDLSNRTWDRGKSANVSNQHKHTACSDVLPNNSNNAVTPSCGGTATQVWDQHAQTYDGGAKQATRTDHSRTSATCRRVYQHDSLPTWDDDSNIDNIDANIHELMSPFSTDSDTTSSSSLSAFCTTMTTRRPSMGRDTWHSLDSESQRIWDTLSDESKQVILGQRPSQRSTPQHPLQNPRRNVDANPCRSANEHEISLHDISAYEFLAAMHDQDEAPSPTETKTDTDTTSDDADSTLLAHMTKQKTVHPGDMRRVLSSTMSKYSKRSGTPNKSANEATPSKPELTINGKTYRAVNQTTLVYDVLQRCVWKNGALVDRGANGGIGGDDV